MTQPDDAKQRQRKLRLEDIAKQAGVSISTVSRALNGGARVNADTRQLILGLAENARYNTPGRRRSRAMPRPGAAPLKVVMAPSNELPTEPINPFSLGLLGGIAKAMRERGLDFSVSHSVPADARSFNELLESNGSEVMIVLGQQQLHPMLNQLARDGFPFVVWGAELEDQSYCCVGSDNLRGGQRATEHLLRLGRRRIAFLGGLQTMELSQRHQGYLAALERASLKPIPDLHLRSSLRPDVAAEAVDTLLQRGTALDGIVAASDMLAIGAMRSLAKHGLRVPDDVAVVGYDDIEISAYTHPSLTTLRQDPVKAGRLLVAKALLAHEGKKPHSERLPVELIVRESCGA
ncbi:LacI family DNA-binding transcriptional regulator [Lysobacter firmicutimachus]|uniref:LacI family DNA-binding transcriptional regulator n=1 Tax=Lysobacter firmicutimachus TaxID=1792846 RepID=A0AAU8MR36_9GAMM